MKFGARKPSLKKSIKARTTGKAKRQLKKAVIPGYGQKGTGWIKDPKKAAYNKIYNKTTFDIRDTFNNSSSANEGNEGKDDLIGCMGCGCTGIVLFILAIIIFCVL